VESIHKPMPSLVLWWVGYPALEFCEEPFCKPVEFLYDLTAMECKWVYETKRNVDWKIKRFKAHCENFNCWCAI